jgi:hypothetical protein
MSTIKAVVGGPPAVRQVRCPLCWARPAESCQAYFPSGDHLGRWLAACATGQVTRSQLAAVVSRLTVIARQVIVPDAIIAALASDVQEGAA